MRKYLMVASASLLALGACQPADESQSGPSEEDTITVYTTIFPYEDWTKKIGGEFVEVENIVPVGADAHTYEPTPQTMIDVAEADAFIYNGASLEAFADKITSAVEDHDVVTLEASAATDLIASSHDHDHGHDHGNEHDDGHDHDDHNHEAEDEHDHHNHEGEDGHDHDHHDNEGEAGDIATATIDGLADHYHSGDTVELTAQSPENSDHWHWYTLAAGGDAADPDAWEVVPDNHSDVYTGTAEEDGIQIIARQFDDDHHVIAESEPVTIQIDDHEEEGGSHDGHHHGDQDPHVWLDPIRSIEMAEAIKDMLVELKPEQEAYFNDNFETLKAQFEELDTQMQEMVNDASVDTFIVSHAGYGYWEERYGIKQIGIAGISSTDEPSQTQLVETVETAKELGLHYVVFEPNITPSVAKVVQDHLGAEALTIHPLEALTQEDEQADADYFSIMENNIETLRTALNN
ncbi:MAG: ABC transporter substrate-binding protein [Shouchella clausii]|jgi:zinc transport system substrate-binding protein